MEKFAGLRGKRSMWCFLLVWHQLKRIVCCLRIFSAYSKEPMEPITHFLAHMGVYLAGNRHLNAVDMYMIKVNCLFFR